MFDLEMFLRVFKYDFDSLMVPLDMTNITNIYLPNNLSM